MWLIYSSVDTRLKPYILQYKLYKTIYSIGIKGKYLYKALILYFIIYIVNLIILLIVPIYLYNYTSFGNYNINK